MLKYGVIWKKRPHNFQSGIETDSTNKRVVLLNVEYGV